MFLSPPMFYFHPPITGKQRIILALILLIGSHPVVAQQVATLRGRVLSLTDSTTAIPLPHANVALLRTADSTLICGTSTNAHGHYTLSLPNQRSLHYLLRVSHVGMKTEYRTVQASSTTLQDITLNGRLELQGVIVTSNQPPIRAVGDTTMIEAAAFRTPDGAYLKDLVRRIPGLNYDSHANTLTYNGEPLNEILVNGEAFFSGNKQVALENLPAELIARLKVYNKKSEQQEFTGMRDTDDNYVMDLQTKKKLNGTLMASVSTAMGNHHKHNHELTANYFRRGGENLSLNSSLGNTKITSNYDKNSAILGALNFTQKPTLNLTLNGNVYAGNERRGERNASYQEQYLLSESQNIYRTGFQDQQNKNVNSMLKLLYRIDRKLMITWDGTLQHNGNNNSSDTRQAAYHMPIMLPKGISPLRPWDYLGAQTSSHYEQTSSIRSDIDNDYYTNHMGINYRLNEKGNTLGLDGIYRYTSNKAKQFAHNAITFHRIKNNNGIDSVLQRNLYYDTPQTNTEYELTVLWTQPITKHLRIQLATALQAAHASNRRSVYDLSPWELAVADCTLPAKWETALTDSLSDQFNSQTDKFIHKIKMNYQRTQWGAQAEIATATQKQTLHRQRGLAIIDTMLRNRLWNAKVQINGKWGANNIRATYSRYTRHPNPTLLLSLPDLSNPMNIHLGNKHLKPLTTHTLHFQWDNPKMGLYTQSEWRQESNSITYASIYDPQSGGRTSFPINVSGNKLLHGNIRYTKLLHNILLTLQADGRWQRQVGMIGEAVEKKLSTSITNTYGINSKLTLNCQKDWGGMMLSAESMWNKHTNSILHTSIHQQDYVLEGSVFADLPLDLQTETHLYYVRQMGNLLERMEPNRPVWDITVSWRFRPKKQARIALAWTDILQGKRNYSRQAYATGYRETHTLQVGSYFLLSFTYRLNIKQ